MKIKLLSKIRKRYQIIHYPDGVYLGEYWTKGPITVLTDKEQGYRKQSFSGHEGPSYREAYNTLRKWIEEDYRTSRKRKNVEAKVLWFKK